MIGGCQFRVFHKFKIIDLPRCVFSWLFLSSMFRIKTGNRNVLNFWMIIMLARYRLEKKISTLLGGISTDRITYSLNREQGEKLNVHDDMDLLNVLQFYIWINFLQIMATVKQFSCFGCTFRLVNGSLIF